MNHDITQCLVCSAQFPHREGLAEHIGLYQCEIRDVLARAQDALRSDPPLVLEIATFISRLQDLVSHHGVEPNHCQSIDENCQEVSRASQRVKSLRSAEGDASAPSVFIDNSTRVEQKPELECPHEDCQEEPPTFSRKQDLERHYALHFELHECCQSCGALFTHAKKCMTHKCASADPVRQRQRKKRIKALRKDIKRELDSTSKARMCYHGNHSASLKRDGMSSDFLGRNPQTQPAIGTAGQSIATWKNTPVDCMSGLSPSQPISSGHPPMSVNIDTTADLAPIYNLSLLDAQWQSFSLQPFPAPSYAARPSALQSIPTGGREVCLGVDGIHRSQEQINSF